MNLYCPKCGTSQSAWGAACIKCGAVLPNQMSPAVYPASQNPTEYAPYPSVNVNPLVGGPMTPPQYGAYPYTLPVSGTASVRSVVGMVLGLASFVFGGPLMSIPGLILSKMEINAIRRGEAPKAGETYAKVGFYSSLVNLILIGLVLLLFFLCIAALNIH